MDSYGVRHTAAYWDTRTLGTSGDLWGPLGTSGDLWGPLGTSGDLWGPLGTSGDLWGPLGTPQDFFARGKTFSGIVLRGLKGQHIRTE